MGGRDREDPAGHQPEEASGPPMESEAPGTKINSKCNFNVIKYYLSIFKEFRDGF